MLIIFIDWIYVRVALTLVCAIIVLHIDMIDRSVDSPESGGSPGWVAKAPAGTSVSAREVLAIAPSPVACVDVLKLRRHGSRSSIACC